MAETDETIVRRLLLRMWEQEYVYTGSAEDPRLIIDSTLHGVTDEERATFRRWLWGEANV